MGRHFARGMVVLADGEPGSEAPQHMSATYAELTIALAREGADIPGADEVAEGARDDVAGDAGRDDDRRAAGGVGGVVGAGIV